MDAWATTRRCSRWSPAPTSRVASTRATRPGSWPPAGWPCRPTSSSARRWATATWPASAAASWMSSGPDLKADVIYQIGALQALARVGRHVGQLRQAARRALPRGQPARGAGSRAGRRRTQQRPGPGRSSGRPGRSSCPWPPAPACGRCAKGFADRGYDAAGWTAAAWRARGSPHRPGNRCGAGGSAGPDRPLRHPLPALGHPRRRHPRPGGPAARCRRPGCRSSAFAG